MIIKYEIGDRLWYVPRDARNQPHELTITAVGRKWLRTDLHLSVEAATLRVPCKGCSDMGQCWRDRKAWEAHQNLLDTWRLFAAAVARGMPKGTTLIGIRMAADALNLNVAVPEKEIAL